MGVVLLRQHDAGATGGLSLLSFGMRAVHLEREWPRWELMSRLLKGENLMNHDPEIEAFYASWSWRKCRQSFLSAKGNLCEACRKKGLIVPATQVHHKQPITPENLKDPAITLNHANLMALCDECHAEQHRKKRWRCDPDGHVRL